MVGQDIQKHNPDSIDTDEGYGSRASTPTHQDDVPETILSSELQKDSEGSYPTECNKNIDESDGEDTLNVLYETHRNEWDLLGDYIDKLESENFSGTINRVQPYVTMYQQVDESMHESTLRASRKRKWQQINTLNSNETTLSSELHITEKDSEGSYPTECNKNIDMSDGEDTHNVLYEAHQSELDLLDDFINDHMDKLGSGNFPGTINRVQPYVTIYQQVDEPMHESTLRASRKRKWQQINTSNSNETTAARAIRESLELIALREDKKILFGMPYYVFSENTSLIDFLVRNLHILKTLELSIHEKHQLGLLSSKISDLVSTGTYMSEGALKLLSPDLLEKRNNYLSNLKQIVCDSIENDKKDGVILERDNGLYYIQCPEESVITPAKFLNNPGFQNLDGALKIGEGDDVIRIQDGKYHDMKGRFQMTFPISNSEKIVMTLSSEKADKPENASSFGKIMVHMDGENCKLFLKHYETLKGKSCTEKIIGRAKSFVEEKNGKQNEQFSVLEEVSISKCSHFNCQRQG